MTLTRSTIVAPESRVQPLLLRMEDAQVVGGVRKFLEGRAVPYNVPTDIGWYTETHMPGEFTKSIRESAKSLPLLLFHDSRSLDSIIGVAEKWTEEADGLWGVWRLSDAEHAQRAAKMAEDGMLGFLSVGFQPIRSETIYDDQDRATVNRLESRLLEVSLTPTPAFQAATVSKVRSAEISLHEHVSGRKLAGWAEWVEKARAAAR
jgi:HK97 family phage prohead protease